MFESIKYDKLFELMSEQAMDAVMIAPSSDMEYLIDYHAHADERLNVLVVLQDRRYFHIAPMINAEEARIKYTEGTNFYVWSDGEGFLETVKTAFDDYDLLDKTVGVNETIRGIDVIDFQEMLDTRFVNAHGLMETYRILKSKTQIEALKKAGAIADQVMRDIKSFIKPGMYEYEIADEIKRLYFHHGAHGLSFEPIIATGKNSSMPHYNKGMTKVAIGDNIVVDCGCKYDNMCSDTSRTFFVGPPSKKQGEIYAICLEATLSAQAMAAKGVTAAEVDMAARSIIEKSGYGQCFLNRTGHGIGFSVHEAPYIKPNSPVVLEEGMAFSIEPGIYMAGEFGMRVENIVVIEDGKGVSVNHSPVAIEEMIIAI